MPVSIGRGLSGRGRVAARRSESVGGEAHSRRKACTQASRTGNTLQLESWRGAAAAWEMSSTGIQATPRCASHKQNRLLAVLGSINTKRNTPPAIDFRADFVENQGHTQAQMAALGRRRRRDLSIDASLGVCATSPLSRNQL